MAQPLSTFECFKRLAPELRLKIWEDALPEPRIIVLKLSHKDGKQVGNVESSCWQWVYTSLSDNHEALSEVNREARYVFLKSYEKSDILEQLGGFKRQLYVDFSRDILYLNARLYPTTPFVSEATRNFLAKLNSGWMEKTTQLAVCPSELREVLGNQFSMEHVASCGTTVQFLLRMFLDCPKLQHLRVVIDGRTRQSGLQKLVKPSKTYPDHENPKQRARSRAAFADFLKRIKEQNPELSVPKTELALFINAKDDADMERHWDYSSASCTFSRKKTDKVKEIKKVKEVRRVEEFKKVKKVVIVLDD